jgi:hypothetical protein
MGDVFGCFGEDGCLGKVVSRLAQAMKKRAGRKAGCRRENENE